MKAFVTAKTGTFLVIASVLALSTLLAAQPVQAHSTALPNPTCSNLPEAAFFAPAETADITDSTFTSAVVARRGEGTTARQALHYAKITIPALAAGELRVFDAATGVVAPSDAVLCRGTSARATFRTNYGASDHNTVQNSVDAAETAATAAETAAADTGITEASADAALRRAASALRSAATALNRVADTEAANLAETAATIATTAADLQNDNSTSDEMGALITAAGALRTASGPLSQVANSYHRSFEIRAMVEPGDVEYVLVVAPDPGTANSTTALHIQFHGAIETTALGHQGSLDLGGVDIRTIAITAPGLLTLATTGNTDTVGTFGSTRVESGGSGGNFRMVLPVAASTADVRLWVEGQTPTTEGPYTLDMDFQVAMPASAFPGGTGLTAVSFGGWDDGTKTADDTDDVAMTPLQINGSADADYFAFMPPPPSPTFGGGFLTIETTDGTGAQNSDTTGTLYGPAGEIVTDSGSGHFHFRAPVSAGAIYLVEVTGTPGQYNLSFALASAGDQASSEITTPPGLDCPGSMDDSNEICRRGNRPSQERDRYLVNIMEPGTLHARSTGETDTIGTLYGPDGILLAEDDNSGQGTNFSLSARVNPGAHIVEVRGQTHNTEGVYGLVTSFVPGEGRLTTPGTGDRDEVTELMNRVAELENDLNICLGTVVTDTEGILEDPAGARSGVGLIRGWVCAASEVTVEIHDSQDVRVASLRAAYGMSRPDVPEDPNTSCQNPNAGFGIIFNYNHLAEGEYTIQAYADGEPVGVEKDFSVNHLVNFATDNLAPFDTDNQDRYLRNLEGECSVENFPSSGETTLLEWEESLQNFVIINVR